MLRVAVGRVHDAPCAGAAGAPAWLGESEQRRWAGLSAASRSEFVASRALLRELLQQATGVPASSWDISAEAGVAPLARPFQAGAPVVAPSVSLSHRLGWVAAAVAGVGVRVGVDMECDRAARSDPAERAALMLAPAEFPAWEGLAADQREPDLLARWTAKEAWYKASPPATAAWDFRQVVARACAPERANVRVWRSSPLHVAVSCADARALAEAQCDGLPGAAAAGSFWHVFHAVPTA
jgi:phosphopantetheinyl transferase